MPIRSPVNRTSADNSGRARPPRVPSRNSPRRSGKGDLLRLAFLVLLALAAVGYSNGVAWIKRPVDAALSAFSAAVAERVTEPLRKLPASSPSPSASSSPR